MMPTRQFPVRNLTEKLGLLVFMLIMLLIFAGQSALAQRGPKYNLKRVDVRLMNGLTISGKLVDITADSIVLHEKNRIVVGCEVYITFLSNQAGMSGTVKSVSESTLVIATSAAPHERLVQRSQIRKLRVKSYPESVAASSGQWSSFSYTEIEYVAMHRVGSGGLGALAGGFLGGLLGGVIAYGATSDTAFLGKEGGAAGGAALGFIVGLPIGAAAGASNKQKHIGGDREKFNALRRQLAPSLGRPEDVSDKKK